MTTLIKEQHVAPRRHTTSKTNNNSHTITQLEYSGLRARAEKLLLTGNNPQENAIKGATRSLFSRCVDQTRSGVMVFFSQVQIIPLIAALYFTLTVFAFLTSNPWGQILQPQLSPVTFEHELVSDSILKRYSSFVGDQDLPGITIDSIDTSQFVALSVSEYRVQPNDTLSDIALKYGLNMDTLVSFNQIKDVRRMQINQILRIPNRDGLAYEVKRGDSLASIAQANNTNVNALLDANNLKDSAIHPGMELFIPNARMDEVDLKLALGELFILPTRGYYSSFFGYRPDPFTGQRRFHNGLDIANDVGTPVWASMGGRVVHIESQIGNYGKFIIIQHPRGYQTLYAHLDSFAVNAGQYVSQGQLIGKMGNTGRSTGPHTHFSVIKNGVFVDPKPYLH